MRRIGVTYETPKAAPKPAEVEPKAEKPQAEEKAAPKAAKTKK